MYETFAIIAFLLWKLKFNYTFKILMWLCKKYQAYYRNFWCTTKIIYFKNISEFRCNSSNFTWFIAHINTKTDDRQTLNFRIVILLIMVPPWKQKLYNIKKNFESQCTCLEVTAKHPLKTYLSSNCNNLSFAEIGF